MQNSDFWTRITNLCGSQTSPVVLCMQYSVISTRIACLYESQPSSVVFACKTAWLASESLVSMGPSPHVWLLDAKQRLFDRNNKSLWVPDITCRFVPASLANELLVSIGPSPHLWFFHANQRLLERNCMSLWVPELTCDFLHSKQRA